MDDPKDVLKAEDAAKEIGIGYQRLVRMIRSGHAIAKKHGPYETSPWLLHISEVQRLKELFAPPGPVTCAQPAAG